MCDEKLTRVHRPRALAGALAVALASSACLGSLLPSTETATNVEAKRGESLASGSVTAREQLAISQLKAIKNAEQFYLGKHDGYGTLDDLAKEGLFNRTSGTGYDFEITVGDGGSSYTVTATPSRYGPDGKRSFYMDDSGTIHGADHGGGPASASDPAV